MNLPRLAIDNFQFTLLVFILLIVAGVNSFITMPRTEDPPINVPGASVIVIYPGASPVDLEELVVTPIEDAINELDDIKRIQTTIREGLAYFSVEFYFGTDAKEKYDEVVQKVNGIRSKLPSEIAELNFLEWTTSDVVILQLALISEKASYREMEQEAERMKKPLQKVEGVKEVDIKAFPKEEIRVSLDFQKMAAMNISLEQVEQSIRSNNANIPGGSMKLSGKTFSIQTSGSYKNLDELGNTVVHSYNGRLVRLRDIAGIRFGYEDQPYLARVSHQRCIFLAVKQKPDFNIFSIRKGLEPELETFRMNIPSDMKLFTVFDQSVWVDKRINNFLLNLLQGIILVGIFILLAMGVRSSIVVILAIPLSIVMGIFVVHLLGFGLQQISIAGLVVALGMLVDNSIVIVQNINRYRSLGYSPREAAITATSEIGWPVVSATATTVLAFIPIIMMPEASGEFIKSLPITIIATLSMSLLVALTLTPLITSKLFKQIPPDTRGRENTYFYRKIQEFIEGPYRRTLSWALRHKVLTLSVAIVVFLFSLYMFQYVGLSFFPKAEKPQFLIQINLPDGSNLDKTNQVAIHVESVLDSIPEVKYYTTNVGHGNPRIYYNIFEKNYAKNFAEIFVQLDRYDPEEFDALITRLRAELSDYPGARINVKEFEQGHPIEAPVMVYLTGENLDLLEKISGDVEEMIAARPGVINVENELSRKQMDIRVEINKEKASLYGVPIVEIDKTVRTAVNGMTVSRFRDDEGKEYNIVLRMPSGDQITASDFDRIFVRSYTGHMIPLKQLASIAFTQSPSMIQRFDLERTALVKADLKKGANLDEVMEPVIRQLKSYPFPNGYKYVISGELESRGESFGGMQIAIIIAMISIFAVLVLQFRSFIQPLVIYAAVPFAVVGMVWALLITGYTFSFSAFIGLISLVGIVVNNSIILVDYSNKLLAQGLSLREAVIRSGETRFTPIILTSLTTIGGLLPLTLTGSSMWAPLGWTIIGGLSVSTFLTLIIVPVLYQVFTKETRSRVEGRSNLLSV
ncbi:MAG: efflux RND transporter permease subunit [Bacteroidetes bacterium]|nr:MAG: efflux RND transporter permease subunit [Bacteroidota bacterium]